MKFSIIVPTYNNIKYLKLFISSIVKNSKYDHELIFHINQGDDGTLEYIKERKFLYTYSKINIGLCDAVNKASLLSTTNYIMFAHDDMYFCKNWDIFLESDLKKYNNNLFYISGTNISKINGIINHDCGDNPDNFNEEKFNNFCSNDYSNDLQGSHWAPHIIHKDLWSKIGGFSPEFNPGDGSDPDLCFKLWKENVRIFKCLSKFKVYHFGSVTTRKRSVLLNDGTKKFILKWGINPRFFRKYFLKGDGKKPFIGALSEPIYSKKMLIELLINKLKYFYYKISL